MAIEAQHKDLAIRGNILVNWLTTIGKLRRRFSATRFLEVTTWVVVAAWAIAWSVWLWVKISPWATMP